MSRAKVSALRQWRAGNIVCRAGEWCLEGEGACECLGRGSRRHWWRSGDPDDTNFIPTRDPFI